MFGLISKKKHDAIVDELAVKVASLEEKNQVLRDWNDSREVTTDQECVVDFDNLRPFSIERMSYGVGGKTVLGYFRRIRAEEGMVTTLGEWELRCNAEQHNRLVEQFKEWLKK